MLNPPNDSMRQTAGNRPRPRRVLIVDDEPHIREAVEVILELSDVQTVSAGSGRIGVRHLRQAPNAFGLIILDLSMPGMSGEETLTALRAVDPQIPIVITSGRAEHELAAETGALAHAYLRKPFSAEGLLDLLDRFL